MNANGMPNAPYFHAEGFSCYALTNSTVHDAVIEIANSQDESYVGHVTAAAAPGANVTKVLWVHKACCSGTFEDINAEASGNSVNGLGTVPCWFGNSSIDWNLGIHVSKLSCLHPGPGQNAIRIEQNGSNGLGIGNSFRDIYMEQATTDSTTPFVEVTLSGTSGFAPADLLDGIRAGSFTGTSYMVDIKNNGSGKPQPRVNISNLGLSYTSGNAINDEANGVTVTGPINSVIASYNMSPSYLYGLTLGATTVSSLPAAATNPGATFRVSDSTAITTEGQTCAGGGSNTALAFSNGSVWKCF